MDKNNSDNSRNNSPKPSNNNSRIPSTTPSQRVNIEKSEKNIPKK